MSERERLRELLAECYELKLEKTEYSIGTQPDFEKIADNLLANGVIVPPVKVGDKVYSFLNNQVFESVVTFWSAFYNGNIEDRAVAQLGDFEVPIRFGKDNIGKTVFLTREDAEKALEERSDEP